MATPSFSSLPSFPFPYPIPFYRGFGGFNPGKNGFYKCSYVSFSAFWIYKITPLCTWFPLTL